VEVQEEVVVRASGLREAAIHSVVSMARPDRPAAKGLVVDLEQYVVGR
jgi:hypothetical protein